MKRFFSISYFLFAVSCTTISNNVASDAFAPNPAVAHRGAFSKNGLPENSIAALKEAIRLGCTGSEFDVRMTADDSLIVMHDPHYHQIAVEAMPFAVLQQYPLANGEAVPTLRQYLQAGLEGNRQTRLVLEIKPSTISKERGLHTAEKVVELVQQMNAIPMVLYISFDYDVLKKIVALQPNAPTQYLTGDRTPDELKKDGILGVDYHISVYRKNEPWIERAKELKVQLNAWTVNEQQDMEWLLERGFHFITTDKPELLLQVLQNKK